MPKYIAVLSVVAVGNIEIEVEAGNLEHAREKAFDQACEEGIDCDFLEGVWKYGEVKHRLG